MKHTKKLLLAMLCIILALTSVLLVVAACNGEETGFKVTVADCEHGTVNVSDPAEGELYDDGESVTVTVTPATDYEVASFKVNGADVELVNGTTYTFNISQDTTIAATFSQIVPETGFSVTVSDYDKAQGSVDVSAPAEGTLYDEGETVTVTVTPAADHVVKSFKVDGVDAELVEGVYSFEIAANTTIAVEFDVERHDVTLNLSHENGGVVTFDTEKPEGGFAKGTVVKFSIEPNYCYELESVYVGEDELTADAEGKYSVTVNDDVTVDVTFTILNAEEVLDSLTGSLKVEGTWQEENFIEETITETGILTIFDNTNQLVLMQRYDGTRLTSHYLLKNVGGAPAMVYHDPDGTIAYDNEDADFADFFNPFDVLDPEVLIPLREGVWTVDDDSAGSILEAIFGVSSNIESFELYVDEDFQATRLVIVLARFSFASWGIDYQQSFDFDLTEHGTAVVPAELYTNYESTDGHNKLKTALEKAAQATSYTVRYQGTEEGYGTNDYHVYYTENAIYEDLEGWEQGWFTRADGNVWEFQYGDGKFEISDLLGDDLSYYKAQFTVKDSNGDHYILLKDNGDNSFEVRQEDEFNLYFAEFVGAIFATGRAELETFSNAYTVKIVLDENGDLYQVILDYDYYVVEHVVLTFSDWNATTIPADALADINAHVEGKIDAKYSGEWASEDGKYTLSVTLEELAFNGATVAADKVTATADKVDFVVGEDSYSIAPGENGHIVLTGGKLEASVELAHCNWVEFIGEFVGTFYDGADDEVGKDVTLIITGFEVKLGFDDEEPAAVEILEAGYLSYDNGDYVETWFRFRFKVGEIEYVLDQSEEGNYDEFILAKVTGSTGSQLTGWGVYRNQYEELKDWEPYYGEFEGEGYNIVIDENGITITVGEDIVTIAKADVEAFTDYDYDVETYYTQFRFTYKDKKALIQPDDDGLRYVLFVADRSVENYEVLQILSVDFVMDWSDYVSAWEGYEENTDEYYLVEVTEDAVYITVGEDGERQEAKVVFYEEGEYGPEFTLNFNDQTLYLFWYTDFGFGGLSNADESVYVSLDQVLAYHLFYDGVFTSRDGKYEVVIGRENIVVTIDDGEPKTVSAEDVYFYVAQNGAYTFMFSIDGTSYFLQQTGIEFNKLIFTDRNFQVKLFIEGYTFDVSEFVGTYVLDDESGSYSVVVSAEGEVTFTIGEKEYEGTDVDVTLWNSNTGRFYELSFVANGIEYYFQVSGDRAFLYNGEEEGSENYLDIELQKEVEKCPWEAYIGEYETGPEDDDPHVTISITADEIVVHVGENVYTALAAVIEFSHENNGEYEYDQIAFTANGVNWTIMGGFSGSDLSVFNDSDEDWVYTTVYKNETGGDDEPITWDDKFIGVYTYNAGEGEIYTITITADTITFTEPGEGGETYVGKVLEYDEVEWYILVDFNGQEYTLQDQSMGEDDPITKLFVMEFRAAFVRTNVESAPWTAYIGEYESDPEEDAQGETEHVTISITKDGFVVGIGDNSVTIGADKITYAHQTSEVGEYDLFSFPIDDSGTIYNIIAVDNTELQLFDGKDLESYEFYVVVYNKDASGEGDDDPIIWDDKFVGTYTGVVDEVTYTLEINADSIYFTIGEDGDTCMGRVLKYDPLEGYFTVVFSGVQYTITDSGNKTNPVAQVYVSQDNGDLKVYLDRVVPSLGIPEGYIGKWTGVDSLENDIVLNISDTEISLSTGSDPVVASFVNVGTDSITFKVGTFTWIVTINEGGLHLKLDDEYNDRTADLTKAPEFPDIPQGFIGTWKGTTAIGSPVVLVITDTELTISFYGVASEVTDVKVDENGAIQITAGGMNYTITIIESGLHLACTSSGLEDMRTGDLTKSA